MVKHVTDAGVDGGTAKDAAAIQDAPAQYDTSGRGPQYTARGATSHRKQCGGAAGRIANNTSATGLAQEFEEGANQTHGQKQQ